MAQTEFIVLLPYFVSATICLTIAIYCWLHRATPGAAPFAITALLRFFVVIGFIFELLSPSLQGKLFWDGIQWVTLLETVPTLAFATAFAGIRLPNSRVALGLVAILPVGFVLVTLLNLNNNLIYIDPHILSAPPFGELTYTFTLPMIILVLYIYCVEGVAVGILSVRFVQAHSVYRAQIATVITGILLPLIGSLLILFGVLNVLPHRDITPFLYVLGYMAVAWGLFRWRLFSIVPIAYNRLFAGMTDQVYVIDNEDRLVDYNPAAQRLLARPASEVIGMPTNQIWPNRQEIIDHVHSVDDLNTEITVDTPQGPVSYDLRVTPLRDRVGRLTGKLIVARNITAYKLAQQKEHDLRVFAEALVEVSQALNSSLNLDEVLALIVENIQKIVPCKNTSISLIHDDGMVRDVRSTGFEGAALTALQQVVLPVETPSIRQMIATGKPYRVANTNKDPDWLPAPDMQSTLISYLGVPIILDGAVVGFINLGDDREDVFTQVHADRLQVFSAQAATAIKNARLYADIQARNAELDAYSHTVAHDLKNPLSVMLGYANLLRTTYKDVSPEDVETWLTYIENYTLKTRDIIDNLLLFATLRDAQIKLSSSEIKPLIDNVQMRLADQITNRNVIIEVSPDLPLAKTYSPWLEEVFANLISNAIKYAGKDNATPCISVRGSRQNKQARFEVQDNGLGITLEDQKRMFKPFTRFHAGEGEGQGLGLSIVQRIVHRLGGEIGVTSSPGSGSTFWFTLPAARPRSGRASLKSTV